jgi:hypothetical protein
MNRLCAYAIVVAALSAVSYPAGALMFGAVSTANAPLVQADAPPQARSPEGKPVRVISLLPADPPVEAASPAQPEMSGLGFVQPAPRPETDPKPVSAVRAKPVVHAAADVRGASKRGVAAPRRARSALLPRAGRAIAAGSLFGSLY